MEKKRKMLAMLRLPKREPCSERNKDPIIIPKRMKTVEVKKKNSTLNHPKEAGVLKSAKETRTKKPPCAATITKEIK